MLESKTTDVEAILASLQAPTYELECPEELWSEILPGLWQGGTDDDDVIHYGGGRVGITTSDFDFVATMYASAKPVDWFVREMRFGFYDHDMCDFNTADLVDIVTVSHRQWKKGNRVLIRCQAGLNRSGLVMALVLIREGYSPAEAIHLIRTERGNAALCNRTFEEWLLRVDVEQWRS